MKVVNADEMRLIDKKTIEEYGVPGSVLMERAGLAVAEKVRELFEKKKVIVLSGGGNNGGDGLVAARNLFNWGWNVRVLLLLKEDRLSPDCLIQYRTAKKLGLPIEFRSNIDEKDLHSAVVVDAILGTGINKAVASPMSDLIGFINRSHVAVISVDIPSGISSDNGQVMGEAVRADYTVTFGLPKTGHLLYPGAEFTGELFIEDIGFPAELLGADSLKTHTIERTDASVLIPERPRYSHKGDFGHVLIVAGSRGKTGAALMSARACLRAGAGMVTIGVPESLADIFQSRVTEEMVLPLPDAGNGRLSAEALDEILHFSAGRIDVLAIGPGIGVSDDTIKMMKQLVQTSPVPLVLDADGINSLQDSTQFLKKSKSPVILTPHTGELARMLGQKADVRNEMEADRINTARFFVRDTGAYLVLKGAPTVIAEPEGRIFINTTGNPGMATAGSGDVLTGMIAAFLGQGLNPIDASIIGTYMHGLAGDIAATEKGMHSLIASDIIDTLPAAFAALKND
ncbi:MAG: NAD(P)H-hydrate dehydratase [Nitrospirae bacterium]|nr:NAD(P)H-hydrate dehydratase [Nitrospirota bacterium]